MISERQPYLVQAARRICLCVLVAVPVFLAPFGIGDSLAAGGGGALPLPSDEISPADRARISAAIDISVKRMQRTGRIAQPPAGAHVTFQWPLQMVPGHPELVARTVTNFVDHNHAYPNQVQDYMCHARSYDQSNGYNHQGTDITTWPFAQRKQNNDEAIVVAAAAGTIVFKEDGMPDHSCSLSSQQWNAVYLRHGDGSVTWYGHLKANSLTTKQMGDSVAAGEFLGVMGSSGDSTGPHVHFEVHDSAGNVIDPFAGPCNPSTAQSWWADQRPYEEPAIDLVTTGNAPVNFNACPTPEAEHRSAYFQPGQTVYATAFLTDQVGGTATAFTVYTPDGTLFATTT